MSLTVRQANEVARQLDARVNAGAERAIAVALAVATSRCGGCVPGAGHGGQHRPGCPEAA